MWAYSHKKFGYVLLCTGRKSASVPEYMIYIGATNNLSSRQDAHKSGAGSTITSQYQYFMVLDQFHIQSHHDEMSATLDYMYEFGPAIVRGSAWTNIAIWGTSHISMIDAAHDLCYKCHEKFNGHRNCQARELPQTNVLGKISNIMMHAYRRKEISSSYMRLIEKLQTLLPIRRHYAVKAMTHFVDTDQICAKSNLCDYDDWPDLLDRDGKMIAKSDRATDNVVSAASASKPIPVALTAPESISTAVIATFSNKSVDYDTELQQIKSNMSTMQKQIDSIIHPILPWDILDKLITDYLATEYNETYGNWLYQQLCSHCNEMLLDSKK